VTHFGWVHAATLLDVHIPNAKPSAWRPKCCLPTPQKCLAPTTGKLLGWSPALQNHTKSTVGPQVCHNWTEAHQKVGNVTSNVSKMPPKGDLGTPLGTTLGQIYRKSCVLWKPLCVTVVIAHKTGCKDATFKPFGLGMSPWVPIKASVQGAQIHEK